VGCAGAGVSVACGVGEGGAVGEAVGCGVAVPGVALLFCANAPALQRVASVSDDADISRLRNARNEGRLFI
jgi:hypothetical protein